MRLWHARGALLGAFLLLICTWPAIGQTNGSEKLCDQLQLELIGTNPATAVQRDGSWQVFWPGKSRFAPTIALLLKYDQAELTNGKIYLKYDNPEDLVESLGPELVSYLSSKTKLSPIEELNHFLSTSHQNYTVKRGVGEFFVEFPTNPELEITLAALLNTDKAVYVKDTGIIRVKSTTTTRELRQADNRLADVLRPIVGKQGKELSNQKQEIEVLRQDLKTYSSMLTTLQELITKLELRKMPVPTWVTGAIILAFILILALAVLMADHHKQLEKLTHKKNSAGDSITVPVPNTNGAAKKPNKVLTPPQPDALPVLKRENQNYDKVMKELAGSRKLQPVPQTTPHTEDENV